MLMVMGGSLLQHVELRAEIERLRAAHGPARAASRERASDASLRARRRAALALAHGRVRELELERRVGRG